MRGNELLDKMELVEPAYVQAADAAPRGRKRSWTRWGALAACVTVIFVAGFFTLQKNDSSTVSFGGITRSYKNVNVTVDEIAIEWPWEYLTAAEQYTTMTFQGKTYSSRGRAIDRSLLDEGSDSCEASGFDIYTEREYQMTCEVRRIHGVSGDQLTAVKLDDNFYVFKNDSYEPPATFGEVLGDYSLAQTLHFDQFDLREGSVETGHYRLKDDDYIWEILSGCRDAVFVEDDILSPVRESYISFTATSEALGVYKRVFYVSSDGYISTNIFDWAFTFRIGEAAAEQIFSYATEKGIASEKEPYTSSLAGTLVEIGEGYLLVDDSILCATPKDGMVFRIPTDDLRISRCIDYENIGVGDTVIVYFTGSIDTNAQNLVSGAYSMSAAGIYDGDVTVDE